MTKTSDQIIAQAHRRLGLLSVDEAVSADQHAYAKTSLEAEFASLTGIQGATITWTIETVPEAVFFPLSDLLAASIAPHYAVVPPVSYTAAILRVRSYLFPDDRDDYRDLDEDGTISDAEADAAKRAAFY